MGRRDSVYDVDAFYGESAQKSGVGTDKEH